MGLKKIIKRMGVRKNPQTKIFIYFFSFISTDSMSRKWAGR
jgi:hypothetical protein